MASAAIYNALAAFLDGDAGDVASTINAEQTGLLVSGAVTMARTHSKSAPRRLNPPSVSVEIVPRGESTPKAVGIGYEEVTHAIDLECSVRRKDLPQGKNQLQTVEDMARALVRRYRLVSNLSTASPGRSSFFGPFWPRPWFLGPFWGFWGASSSAIFVRSDAIRVALDTDPEAAERIRAVVRVSFTFIEALAANA